MNEAQWEQFFYLLRRVVNMKGLTADEKAEKVREYADALDASGCLEEFVSWYDGDASREV